MPAVLSTPAGATVIFLSSTWPHSLHSSSNKMTFWSDFLSALAQLMLLTSSTFLTTAAAAIEFNNNFQTSTTITVTSSPSPSSSSTSNSFSTIAYPSNASFQHGNSHSSDALKRTINHVQHRYSSDRMRDEDDDESGAGGGSVTSIAALAITKETMFNLTTTTTIKPQQSPSPETSSFIGVSQYSNLTVTAAVVTDSALNNKHINNLVDCNDFTEQKLLNIVICAISDVNSNVINGTISADNSTFGSGNDTLRNISDEFGRFYNASDGSDITGNNNDTLNHTIEFEHLPFLSFKLLRRLLC